MMESNCCGANPLGEISDGWAFCSDCKEMAFFEEEWGEGSGCDCRPGTGCTQKEDDDDDDKLGPEKEDLKKEKQKWNTKPM